MVLFNAPHIVGNAKLIGHIAQVLMVRHDTGNVAVELSCLPACQQVVETVTHLRNEDGHPRTLVAVIEREFHLVALSIKRSNIVIKLVAWNKETFKFPFYAHEEHAVYLVHILIEVNNITFVIGYEFCHLRYNALLVGTV